MKINYVLEKHNLFGQVNNMIQRSPDVNSVFNCYQIIANLMVSKKFVES